MMGLFDGKVALVTGGATGIGRAAAVRYAAEGASVVVADINAEEAQQTVELAEAAGGRALFVAADMTSSTDIQDMVTRTLSQFGRLDVAFNNAGTPGGFTNVVDCTEDEWDTVMALNLKSVWLCMKYEIPAMITAGGGAIVNTASATVNAPSRRMVSYVASKHGVIGLTQSAAKDFADQNIRVNTLLPGKTLTPMLEQGAAAHNKPVGEFLHAPMQRHGEPKEQADVVIWLTSTQSSFVTGQSIAADGGSSLGNK
jgi:NAD(P)-dependent dehydrogenase (short-subunit alcohol dehydrogenase family)